MSLMFVGNKFHSVGAHTLNERDAKVLSLTYGTIKRVVSVVESRFLLGGGGLISKSFKYSGASPWMHL